MKSKDKYTQEALDEAIAAGDYAAAEKISKKLCRGMGLGIKAPMSPRAFAVSVTGTEIRGGNTFTVSDMKAAPAWKKFAAAAVCFVLICGIAVGAGFLLRGGDDTVSEPPYEGVEWDRDSVSQLTFYIPASGENAAVCWALSCDGYGWRIDGNQLTLFRCNNDTFARLYAYISGRDFENCCYNYNDVHEAEGFMYAVADSSLFGKKVWKFNCSDEWVDTGKNGIRLKPADVKATFTDGFASIAKAKIDFSFNYALIKSSENSVCVSEYTAGTPSGTKRYQASFNGFSDDVDLRYIMTSGEISYLSALLASPEVTEPSKCVLGVTDADGINVTCRFSESLALESSADARATAYTANLYADFSSRPDGRIVEMCAESRYNGKETSDPEASWSYGISEDGGGYAITASGGERVKSKISTSRFAELTSGFGGFMSTDPHEYSMLSPGFDYRVIYAYYISESGKITSAFTGYYNYDYIANGFVAQRQYETDAMKVHDILYRVMADDGVAAKLGYDGSGAYLNMKCRDGYSVLADSETYTARIVAPDGDTVCVSDYNRPSFEYVIDILKKYGGSGSGRAESITYSAGSGDIVIPDPSDTLYTDMMSILMYWIKPSDGMAYASFTVYNMSVNTAAGSSANFFFEYSFREMKLYGSNDLSGNSWDTDLAFAAGLTEIFDECPDVPEAGFGYARLGYETYSGRNDSKYFSAKAISDMAAFIGKFISGAKTVTITSFGFRYDNAADRRIDAVVDMLTGEYTMSSQDGADAYNAGKYVESSGILGDKQLAVVNSYAKHLQNQINSGFKHSDGEKFIYLKVLSSDNRLKEGECSAALCAVTADKIAELLLTGEMPGVTHTVSGFDYRYVGSDLYIEATVRNGTIKLVTNYAGSELSDMYYAVEYRLIPSQAEKLYDLIGALEVSIRSDIPATTQLVPNFSVSISYDGDVSGLTATNAFVANPNLIDKINDMLIDSFDNWRLPRSITYGNYQPPFGENEIINARFDFGSMTVSVEWGETYTFDFGGVGVYSLSMPIDGQLEERIFNLINSDSFNQQLTDNHVGNVSYCTSGGKNDKIRYLPPDNQLESLICDIIDGLKKRVLQCGDGASGEARKVKVSAVSGGDEMKMDFGSFTFEKPAESGHRVNIQISKAEQKAISTALYTQCGHMFDSGKAGSDYFVMEFNDGTSFLSRSDTCGVLIDGMKALTETYKDLYPLDIRLSSGAEEVASVSYEYKTLNFGYTVTVDLTKKTVEYKVYNGDTVSAALTDASAANIRTALIISARHISYNKGTGLTVIFTDGSFLISDRSCEVTAALEKALLNAFGITRPSSLEFAAADGSYTVSWSGNNCISLTEAGKKAVRIDLTDDDAATLQNLTGLNGDAGDVGKVTARFGSLTFEYDAAETDQAADALRCMLYKYRYASENAPSLTEWIDSLSDRLQSYNNISDIRRCVLNFKTVRPDFTDVNTEECDGYKMTLSNKDDCRSLGISISRYYTGMWLPEGFIPDVETMGDAAGKLGSQTSAAGDAHGGYTAVRSGDTITVTGTRRHTTGAECYDTDYTLTLTFDGEGDGSPLISLDLQMRKCSSFNGDDPRFTPDCITSFIIENLISEGSGEEVYRVTYNVATGGSSYGFGNEGMYEGGGVPRFRIGRVQTAEESAKIMELVCSDDFMSRLTFNGSKGKYRVSMEFKGDEHLTIYLEEGSELISYFSKKMTADSEDVARGREFAAEHGGVVGFISTVYGDSHYMILFDPTNRYFSAIRYCELNSGLAVRLTQEETDEIVNTCLDEIKGFFGDIYDNDCPVYGDVSIQYGDGYTFGFDSKQVRDKVLEMMCKKCIELFANPPDTDPRFDDMDMTGVGIEYMYDTGCEDVRFDFEKRSISYYDNDAHESRTVSLTLSEVEKIKNTILKDKTVRSIKTTELTRDAYPLLHVNFDGLYSHTVSCAGTDTFSVLKSIALSHGVHQRVFS